MSGNVSTPPLEAQERDRIERHASRIQDLRGELRKRIVGQEEVITQVLAAILAEGHCLIIGLPGLAKTLLVSSIAELLSLDFKRIQFTPDLMPSDITGTTIISENRQGGRGVRFVQGPVFSNILLADEINRTPPKTQAALMEAMEERQVSVAGSRMPLARPFFVLATQNPIELEGTYPLPVSELDRFLFNITIDYPSEAEEFRILMLTTSTYKSTLQGLFTRDDVVDLLNVVHRIQVPPELLTLASRIVRATRPSRGDAGSHARQYVAWGAGPRAAQSMILGAKALALMDGRPEISAADLHRVVAPTLRHRIILRYHAQAEGVRPDDVVQGIVKEVAGEIAGAAARASV